MQHCTYTLPTLNKKRLPPKPRLINVKQPKERKKSEYDDIIANEQLVASSAEAENKRTNFGNFSSPKFINNGSQS